MKLQLLRGICLLPLCLGAQTTPSAGPSAATQSSPPIYVLYRLFFRDIAQLDTAAANSDSAGLPGGNLARGWYQSVLALTDAQAAALKQAAAQCNQALDQHQQTAQPVIAAVQTQIASSSVPATPPPQLVALEQQRTTISNTCIQNLQAAIGAKKFADIDVFVRTKFSQKVSALPPPGAPFAGTPVTRTNAGANK